MTGELTITIASVPDKEELVAELWLGLFQWAELSRRNEDFTLAFYPLHNVGLVEIPYEEVTEKLKQAKFRLLGKSED